MTVISANGKKFGGFAASSWNTNTSGGYQHSDGNFIFMLDPCIKLDCHNRHHAQFSVKNFGPAFGWRDLSISGGCVCSARYVGESYGRGQEQNLEHFRMGGWNYEVFAYDDYEVFAVK